MPTTQIACLGLSHHSAPVELRERLSCGLLLEDHIQPTALEEDGSIREHFSGLSEIALLTTCNRIELYAAVDTSSVDLRQLLVRYLSRHHDGDLSELDEFLYFHRGEDAVRHLLRVACGLDSQILGEPQILGQVTGAFTQAVEARSIGPMLTTLFRGAIRAGKKARAHTAISTNPASLGSVSIAHAEQIVGPLNERTVLVIGLGEMGRLAINALRKRGVQRILVANRTRRRAEQLASAWHGAAYGMDELPQALAKADVVISATAAPGEILDVPLIEPTVKRRPDRKLVIIDIALPRDVNPQIGKLPGVHLYNMDDLRQSLDEALAARRREIPRVESVINVEMSKLRDEFKQLAISPVIVDLRQRAEAIRRQELDRTLRFIGEDVDPETLKHVQHLSRSLVNKLLHEPTVRLREHASNGQANAYADAVRDLFDLPDTTESER